MQKGIALAMKNKGACILLAVWGEQYINDLLQFSLLSLLAPGNIPALAKVYKTRFVFLTREEDIKFFEKQRILKKLRSHCTVDYISINDLIVFGNYSTTLTLAYERAIHQTGAAMLNTYFIFLTSDYIMANGSLEGLMSYIDKGYSGICTGNFQVIESKIKPFITSKVNLDKQVLSIKPRELLKESLNYLHPVTVASVINQPAICNYQANRFFYLHQKDFIASRFYLLHMLCIKPETMDYNIGSSCDYSFISEMCPSGNIAIIKDSDDYLVVEIQAMEHELNFVKWGKYNTKHLAHALGEWTTKQHRANAEHTIYFHTRDLTHKEIDSTEKMLKDFIDPITEAMRKYPAQPHINHPYWGGAINSFRWQQQLIAKTKDCEYFDFEQMNLPNLHHRRIYNILFGNPPAVYPWHYRWREYSLTRKMLKKKIDNKKSIVILYEGHQNYFLPYFNWFKNVCKVSEHYHVTNLMSSAKKLTELQSKKFDTCILLIRIDDLDAVKATLNMIQSILKKSGNLKVLFFNKNNYYSKKHYDFQGEFALKSYLLVGERFNMLDVATVHNNLTHLGASTVYKIKQHFSYSRTLRRSFLITAGVFGTIYSSIRNMLLLPFNFNKGHCTNILLELKLQENITEANDALSTGEN